MSKNIYLKYVFIAFLFMIVSCKKKEASIDNSKEPIVTVLEQTLYRHQLNEMITNNLSLEDSISMFRDFIRKWIDDVLIYQKAKKNIINKNHIDELVENYRQALIIHSYEDDLVKNKIIKDNSLSEDKLQDYYNKNKYNLPLKQPIIRGLYLKIPLKSSQLSNFRKWYTLGTEKAIEEIDKNSLQNAIGYEYFYNKWINFHDILSTIPHQVKDYDQFLKNNKSLDVQDSSYVYLLHIKEYKLRGDVAPFDFVRDNINQIIREQNRNNYLLQIKRDLYNKALLDQEIKFYE